jgi:hypothetical protein
VTVEPTVRATAYAVSCMPPDHPDAYLFTLRVEVRGEDRWCVTDGAYCYRKDGHKAYERNPSGRTDRFKRAYRFSLDDALALAKRLAPKITINGHTVESVLARNQ